jgi:hypothetical protein
MVSGTACSAVSSIVGKALLGAGIVVLFAALARRSVAHSRNRR